MYVIYCQNKPVSEHIVAEHLGYFEEIRLKLKHKLVVSIYILCFTLFDSFRIEIKLISPIFFLHKFSVMWFTYKANPKDNEVWTTFKRHFQAHRTSRIGTRDS